MKRRILFSFIAALVYAATYTGILQGRGEEIVLGEVALGAAIFFVAFFAIRTWLDTKREKQAESNEAARDERGSEDIEGK